MAIADKHYNAMVAARLRPLVAQGDWEALTRYLDSLSNSQFRTAGYMLGETLSQYLLEPVFWSLFSALAAYNSKAFLVTMLKQAVARLEAGTLSLFSDEAQAAYRGLSGNELDVQKVLLALLPQCSAPADVDGLFRVFGIAEGAPRLPYLLRVTTLPAAFQLFRALQYADHDRALLIRTTYLLMKRGDDVSFNLASLLRTHFSLDEVRGSFSLRVEPYQLSRLQSSYAAFCEAMRF
ncbi:MAG: hypothetical protein HUK02_08065 [Bacteroidaceae bacterium]|nr:hypothetical protein [Bacteroidaceae bacterium]